MFNVPRFRLTKLPQSREFNYVPRYYDEDKERMEARKEELKRELKREGLIDGATVNEPYVPNIKGKFRNTHRSNIKAKRQSNLRLIIIMAALFALAFWLIFS